MEVLVWPIAMYSCESWTLRQNEERHLDAFEMKGLRKILRVSWTVKKTNEWVLNKAGVRMELLKTDKAKKLAYYGHTMRKQKIQQHHKIQQSHRPGSGSSSFSLSRGNAGRRASGNLRNTLYMMRTAFLRRYGRVDVI